MPFPLLAACILLAPPKYDLYQDGPYDSAVPRPEKVLGYELGDRIALYEEIQRYGQAVAAAAPGRVRLWQYGTSTQGKPLRLFAIGKPENLSRLKEIQNAYVQISQGKAVDTSKLPALVWVNQCIHGNEPASPQSGMALLYNLAAGKGSRITTALDNAVVILNPVYNPDGAERFAVYYNSIHRGDASPNAFEQQEPGIIHGRTNAYRFDMNRDRVAFSQQETQQEFAEMLRWRPQIYIDQHGQVGTYFFPPEPMSINENVDRARNDRWTTVIGRAIGKEFDRVGFQYFTRDTYDLYYPGYVDSSATLSGAIGMTHETDGGKYVAKAQSDGYVLTLRRGIEKHFVSALSVIRATAANRSEILSSYASFLRDVNSGKAAGKFQRVVLRGDARTLRRFAQHLAKGGIQSSFTTADWTQADATDYWTGKRGETKFTGLNLVVDIAQPQGALAKALLEPASNFEPEFIKEQLAKKKTAPDGETYPGPEGVEFYDQTGWALPYAYNLQAWWCESAPKVAASPSLEASPTGITKGSSAGYYFPYADQEDALAAAAILSAGFRLSVVSGDIKTEGAEIGTGSFIILADRNDADLNSPATKETLNRIAATHGISLSPITSSFPESGRNSPGSSVVSPLRAPKIGIIFGDGSNLGDVSGLWFAMDKTFKLPFTALSTTALRGDLGDYTAIVVPGGVSATVDAKLKDWVRAGGRLIVMDNWNWALGSNGFTTLDKARDVEDLPGPVLRATLDPRYSLNFGYNRSEIAVPAYGTDFYKKPKEGGSAVYFGDEKTKKLLTGWAWPDATDKQLADSLYLFDSPLGRGHVFFFAVNPTDRALWPGLNRLFLNALLMPN
jgi:hypothetical protein